MTWYVGNTEIITRGCSSGAPESLTAKRYLGDNTMVTHHGPDTIDIEYLHKDHLGSIQVISKQGNQWQYHQSYDAFGRHRGHFSPEVKYNLLPTKDLTNRGYTVSAK